MVKINFEKPNQLFYGDNLSIIRALPAATVDLCYIDPPFNSKRNYFQIYNGINEDIDRVQSQAFMDSWYWGVDAIDGLKFIESPENMGGNDSRFVTLSEQTVNLIKGLHTVLGNSGLMAYLISMTLRIAEIHRVLKENGSFYLHCDPTAGHYLKIICDSIFCAKNRSGQFRNEISWHYRRWSNESKSYLRMHDTIFYYSKSKSCCFNIQYQPYSETKYIENTVREVVDGKLKRKKDAQGNYIQREKPNLGVPLHDVWNGLYSELDTLNEENSLHDIWHGINFIAPTSKERMGKYPTQKPQALLERIIKTSSNEGDIVMDAYCGCGTTVAVAQNLGRRWIGIDNTFQSISLILKRLKDSNHKNWQEIENSIHLSGVPEDLESARLLANNRDDRLRNEFEKWAVLTYTNNPNTNNPNTNKQCVINDKKGKDDGIDGISYFLKDRDMKTNKDIVGKIIYQVKSGKLGSKDIRDLIGVCSSEPADLGILITLEEPTTDMYTAAHKAGTVAIPSMARDYAAIQIVTINEIIRQNARLALPIAY